MSLLRVLSTALLLSSLASGCLYDSGQRCGPHQVSIDNDRCACEAGYVPGASGCVACAANERESAGECVCEAGFARTGADGACEEIPEGLGAACSESEPCRDEQHPDCHLVDADSGYCTNAGCDSDEDCSGGYACELDEGEGYCRRPPLGYGQSCEQDADCTGGEATYCENIQTQLCIVPCSAETASACFGSEVCCDFAVFRPVCVPADKCSGTVLGSP